jgi:CHAT domain-containing protein
VVALPRTPGLPDLPAAELESEFVAARLPGCRVLRGPDATRESVMNALHDADIVHFACHTAHDPDRYEGRLLLHDGALTFSDIGRVRADRGGLAFLSACATARPRIDLPDESLSIASGFQLAGFSHTVASLWPIADRTALEVVTDFYTELLTDTGAGAVHALHLAVDRVRERNQEHPSLWAPYIHIGA